MASKRQTTPLEALEALETLRETLEVRKSSLVAEILAYPPPIPACDAQFNHLVAERERITGQLAELSALCARVRAEPGAPNLRQRVKELLRQDPAGRPAPG